MTFVTIRELRNHGGKVIDRAAAGEIITITRDGTPVAELRPITKPPMTAARLVALFKDLPPTDPTQFRADIDAHMDQSI
ncbi:MAG: type II toxin-antitoxin system prevent-host-death family antitoxin [Actinomycetota bacterium]|nr:type II toxin-antitoxin system prevent-host-death family antitoxin [Actinomycetota bacterium]